MRGVGWVWLVVVAVACAGLLAWSCTGADGGDDDDADDADDDSDSVVPPPDAPSDLVAETAGADAIALSWKDNSDDEEGFYVDRSIDGQTWEVAATLEADTTEYTDTGLYCHYFYYYRVRAFNDGGPSLPSNLAFAATDLCPFQPPVDVEATAEGPFTVRLTWMDQSDEESGYLVERSTDQISWFEIGRTPRNAEEYLDKSALCDTTLYYRVAAYKPGETSDYSEVASATTDTCPPCADGFISCNESRSGTTVGQTNEFSEYSCSTWDESGPEFIYQLDLAEAKDVTVSISPSGCDLDIFLLTNCEDPESCIDYGNYNFTTSLAAGTYYIVVDGYYGDACGYSISVSCN